jgi:hypothetical protein
MARGWESKAVEQQIDARESRNQNSAQKRPTKLEIENRLKCEGLMLARARTVSGLATAGDPRYRLQLEKALAHLDSQIAALKA